MILSINPGSSSLKYKLFDSSFNQIKVGAYDISKKGNTKNIKIAVLKMIEELSDQIDEIKKIGIRVVHGGNNYNKPTIISKKVISEIKENVHLAPLHNPASLQTIKIIKKRFNNLPIMAVFDTTFFHDLPRHAKTYPIPYEISQKFNISRLGFHGISHKYTLLEVDPKNMYKVITIHLGSGCSVTAINKGKVIDTSMGFTPIEGLTMQTRSGDIDPGIVLFLVKKIGFKKTKKIIEEHSGLSGLTGTDGNMLDILFLAGEKIEAENYKSKNYTSTEKREQAKLALKIYTNKIKKYIGAYTAIMGGIDIIAFTGKIGANSSVIQNIIMADLKFLNYTQIKEVLPNEELAIAKEIEN